MVFSVEYHQAKYEEAERLKDVIPAVLMMLFWVVAFIISKVASITKKKE